MPCHVARYQHKHNKQVGWALFDEAFYPITEQAQSTAEFISQFRDQAIDLAKTPASERSEALFFQDIEILSPVTKPCRIICQGSNYPSSRLDTGMDPNDKSFNTLFHKSDKSICGPNDDIILPSHVQLLDYEIELGLVIGKAINKPQLISEQNIGDYVAAVVMAHDVTARDIQIPQVQFFKGKSYPNFCPTGPYLCLLEQEEMHYLNEFILQLSVNGGQRQHDNSRHMIYKPHETLTELSQISDLSVGDMVLTGSPGGGALKVPPAFILKILGLLPERIKWQAFVKKQSQNPHYLKVGDQIEASICSEDGNIQLGMQSNMVVK